MGWTRCPVLQGRVSFLQATGVFNISGSSFSGLQASAVFNMIDGNLDGAQVAGVFNTTGRAAGAQIGLVNISSAISST